MPGAASPLRRGRVVQEGVSVKADSMADLAARKVEWWRQNEDNLPHWVGAVKMVLFLLQPTSAAAERVFSLYSERPFLISSWLHSRLCGY